MIGRNQEKIARCQRCGHPLLRHPAECIPVTTPTFDQSQEHLALVDEAAGRLLAAILNHRSIQMLQEATFGSEFLTLLDLRRKL